MIYYVSHEVFLRYLIRNLATLLHIRKIWRSSCNTTIDSKEVYFVLKEFDSLMEAADVQLKKRLLESIIERRNLNPDKTLGEIKFIFEVPNQHVTGDQDKNVILTYDKVLRITLTAKKITHFY